MKAFHVIVEGRVQGVCFRDYTRKQAEQLHIRGWVQNMPNGSVEAVISGQEEDLHTMITWFSTGSPFSRVTSVVATETAPTETFVNFAIRF
jgi:acylphosphatase